PLAGSTAGGAGPGSHRFPLRPDGAGAAAMAARRRAGPWMAARSRARAARRETVHRHGDGDTSRRLLERQPPGGVEILRAADGRRRRSFPRLFAALLGCYRPAVVDGASRRIPQNPVGLDDLAKEGFGVAVPEVDVRRVATRQALVGPSNLGRRGADP